MKQIYDAIKAAVDQGFTAVVLPRLGTNDRYILETADSAIAYRVEEREDGSFLVIWGEPVSYAGQ